MKKTNIEYCTDILANLPDSYKKWFEKEKKYLQKIITPNAKVLDVGCGNGRSIRDILSITKNIIGIDHDNKAITDAKNNFSKYSSVKIIKAEAENLPFENEKFDFVICMYSFVNFGNKKFIILKEMKRVLKQNGKIIISLFSEDAFEERIKIYKKINAPINKINGTTVILDKSFGDNISEQFSKEQLENIFSKTNLNVEDITKVGIAYLCTLTK